MRIAITQRVVENDTYLERRDALSQDWVQYFWRIMPCVTLLPVPNHPDSLDHWLQEAEIGAAILSNGNDWGSAPERDYTETRLVQYCRSKSLPMLGVCRGFQVLNMFFGGKLEANIHERTGEDHAGVDHVVTIMTDLQWLKGNIPQRSLVVNSYHQQGVLRDGLADQLKPFAYTNRVIEGFYHPSEPLIGIQWHPERNNSGSAFDALLVRHLFGL